MCYCSSPRWRRPCSIRASVCRPAQESALRCAVTRRRAAKRSPLAGNEKGEFVTSRPVLANTGAMSTFVGAFEVTSKLTGTVFHCRFSHMWNGIATRHADTIDTKFFVGGNAIVKLRVDGVRVARGDAIPHVRKPAV